MASGKLTRATSDKLCFCMYCGHLFGYDWVTTGQPFDRLDNGVILFRGKPCSYCFRTRPSVKASEYRFVIWSKK